MQKHKITQSFVDFSKAFDSIDRGKMEQILLAYGLPKETVIVIMMLYTNTKAMVHSPDDDTDFFNIVTGVLQGDILVPYLPRLSTLNINRSNKRKCLYTKKKSKEYTKLCRNYKRHRLHRQSSDSCKYTYPSWIPNK